jgi:hypothetical protein
MKLFYLYGYSRVVPSHNLWEDTHEYKIAHVLVDDYVSPVMDIEMLN